MSRDFDVDPAQSIEFPPMDPTGTVDLHQVESNLLLTPAERLRRHDEWLRFTRAAHRAPKQRHGIDPANIAAAD
jgi:hypothetical protein